MRTNELSIKDWVRCNDELCRVWMVDWQYSLIRCHHNGTEWNCGAEEIEPIKLTDKILLDSGFKIVYDSCYHTRFEICNEDESIFVCIAYYKQRHGFDKFYLELTSATTPRINININFVHELQHILRICGLHEIDDNIKVFV